MENWVATARALPGEDEAIQFIVGQRGVPLLGQFREGTFRSRWWCYGTSQVHNWSAIDHVESDPEKQAVAEDRAPMPAPAPTTSLPAQSQHA